MGANQAIYRAGGARLWLFVIAAFFTYTVLWGQHSDHPRWFQGPVGKALFAAAAKLDHAPRPSLRPPSRQAAREIPPRYLRLYQQAGKRYRIPWQVLAGIGAQESGHGQSRLPGVHAGANFAGACGPMQVGCVPGSAAGNSWARYGGGGNVHDPADAIPGAARYLVGHGAHADLRRAVFAYNHSEAYVRRVFAAAHRYGYRR